MASRLNRPAGGSHLIVHRSINYCNAQLVLHFLIGKFVLPSPHTPSMSVFGLPRAIAPGTLVAALSRNCQPATDQADSNKRKQNTPSSPTTLELGFLGPRIKDTGDVVQSLRSCLASNRREPVLVLAEQFGDIGEQDVGGIGPP